MNMNFSGLTELFFGIIATDFLFAAVAYTNRLLKIYQEPRKLRDTDKLWERRILAAAKPSLRYGCA